MNPLTAVALLLAGGALLTQTEARLKRRSKTVAPALSLVLILLASVKLATLFGLNAPIDSILFRSKLDSASGIQNRMAPNTAICLLLVGFALLVTGKTSKNGHFLSDYFTLPPLTIASVAIVGYLYSNTLFTKLSEHTPIAFHTALCILFLCLGILFAPGDSGLVGIFRKETAGAMIGKKMLPCTLYVPLALGWVIIYVRRLGVFDPDLGTTLLAVTGAILGTAILCLNISVVNRLEEALDQKNKTETERKMNRLKRFFPPAIADRIASGEIEDPFKWHRTDITVIFIDIRGFTSFAELAEPEEVMNTLQEYYSSVGKIAQKHGGSIGHVAGDGVMIFFNDPVPIPAPQKSAVIMALEIREELNRLCAKWRSNDLSLHFGAGIASGYTTIGGMGAEGFWDYTIVGTTTNMASRLCSAATEGQILVPKTFMSNIAEDIHAEPVGALNLKGLHQAVTAYNVLSVK